MNVKDIGFGLWSVDKDLVMQGRAQAEALIGTLP